MEGPTEKCLGKLGSLIKYHNYCHHYYYFPISDCKYIKIIELFEQHLRNEYERNLCSYKCYLGNSGNKA